MTLIVIAVAVVVIALVLRDKNGETQGEPHAAMVAEPTGSTTSVLETTTTALPRGITVCDLYTDIVSAGAVASPDLVEASGLAASRVAPGVLWSHNDSRGTATVYAFTTTGEDLGDNFDIRDGLVTVYRVPDADPGDLDGAFSESIPFTYRYPKGSHNAEALFVDPVEPALYLVTKGREEAFVFKGSLVPTDGQANLQIVSTLFLGAEVSGADMSSDGTTLVLRGYRTVWMWHRDTSVSVSDMLKSEPCEAPSPDERQGEAITFDMDLAYWTVSEGSNSPIQVGERTVAGN